MMVSDPVLPQRLPNRLLPAMCGARFARRLACFGAVATFACAGLMPAHAQDSNSSSFSSERNVRNDAREGDDDAGNSELHRVQNRRQNGAASAAGSNRRNLSADERRALHRDLRDAMKGAYSERTP